MQSILAFITILLIAVTLTALFLSVRVLFPLRIFLTSQNAQQMPVRSFLIGLVNGLFFLVLILVFLALADGTGIQIFFLPALALIVILSAGLVFGVTGIVQVVGIRLIPDGNPNRQSILGAVVLILGCLTPFVGWFGLFIYISLLGLGAFIISFFRKESVVDKHSE